MVVEGKATSSGRCGRRRGSASPNAIHDGPRSTFWIFSALLMPNCQPIWSGSMPSWIRQSMHHSNDLLFFLWQHPRWEMVYQPKYAAYLNLIEPWWKTLRSLALKGKKFETWEEVVVAVERATAYWNDHKHPFMWGRRRRHRPPRPRRSFTFQVKTLRIS
jgi:hypothetical protein